MFQQRTGAYRFNMAWSLFVWVALAATSSDVKPEADAEAALLAHRSIAEYNGGDFDQALADMKRAYDIHPGADLLFDMAQCQRALHHWEQAAFFFRGYLRELPDCPKRSGVEALVEEMEQHRLDELADRRIAISEAALTIVPLQADGEPVPAGAIAALSARRRVPTGAWALGGSGLAVGIAGAIAWGIAGADRSGYTGAAGLQPISYARFEQANTGALIGNILVPVGAVLLAAGVGFALFGSSPARAEGP